MNSMNGKRGPTGMQSGGGATGDVLPKGYKSGQMQNFTPEQMQLFSQLFGHVGPDSYLSRLAGGEEGMFNEIEAPALRQFQELQGQMGSRFSGMGMGAQKSSGFRNTMGQMGSDFAMQLQAQRQQLQQQAIKDLMGHSQTLLGQQPYERQLIKKEPGFWEKYFNWGKENFQNIANSGAAAAKGGF